MNVLVINAGSSSIKYKIFKVDRQKTHLLVAGLIEGIGEKNSQWRQNKENQRIAEGQFSDHEAAFKALGLKFKEQLNAYSIQGVGHRVVHGGENYYQPTIITPAVLSRLNDLSHLAPIHNPINILGILFAQRVFPQAIHVAVFDSGFHHSMPAKVKNYAINTEVAARYHIKRYGFHGINHEYVAKIAADHLNKPLEGCNFITLHLGNGASACLIKEGRSFDTSMGLTPLAGLVMGTRCGDIDPAIPLYLQSQGLSGAAVDAILNKESGLKGIAKENDMRQLIERALAQDEAANLAIDTYVYAIQKYIGAYLSQIKHLDALIFTGGIGENAAFIREKIITPLEHFNLKIDKSLNTSSNANDICYSISINPCPILVIRGDEEISIAHKVENLILSLF